MGREHVDHGGSNAGVEGVNPESAREQLIDFVGGERGTRFVAATLFAEFQVRFEESQNLESNEANRFAATSLDIIKVQIATCSAGADGEKFDAAFDKLGKIFKAYNAEHAQKPRREQIELSPANAMRRDVEEIKLQLRRMR